MTADARKNVKGFFQKAFFRLNDSYIITDLTVESLRDSLKSESSHESRAFRILDQEGPWFIEREPDEICQMIRDQIDTGQYQQSLVFIISRVEDFISSIIRVILTADPKKLTHGPKGGESIQTVDVREIFKAKDLQSLRRNQIELRIDGIMRRPASTFLAYLANILGASLKANKVNDSALSDAIERYCEISATRDMIVHTGRTATSDYKEKAKHHCRVEVGEKLSVDKQYFSESIAHIKHLYEHFEEAMIACLEDDDGAILSALTALDFDTTYDPQHSVLPDRRPARPVAAPPAPSPPAQPAPSDERIGVVTHYYKVKSVAVVRLEFGTLRVGDKIRVRGQASDFTQKVESLELNSKPVTTVGPKDEFGLKVTGQARERDIIFKVRP
jgi:hypothetical protein